MKKYLTFAALLGVIAFISVSYLAQANEKAATDAPAVYTAPADPAAPAPAGNFDMDKDICNTIAAAPAAEGTAPSEEAKSASFKKCMMDKGHTEEELKKAEDASKEAAPATETPAAH